MAIRKMQVNDRSTIGAGLPNDFNEVIAQYIWNGFEAGATEISINYDNTNPIGHINSFTIKDNGSGIDYENIDRNFGFFLDSAKVRSKNNSLIHGGKGKGRLSFQLFSGAAIWNTTYKHADGLKEYSITILKGTKDDYNPTDPQISARDTTGTILELRSLDGITTAAFEDGSLEDSLKRQFGWLLQLNKAKKFKLLINGNELDYKSIIRNSSRTVKSFEDEDANKSYQFTIDYIQWNKKIKEKNYNYFLNSNQEEVFKDFTSFNTTAGGAHGFYHSVYVRSDFFDEFDTGTDENPNTQTSILGNGSRFRGNSAFKALVAYLREDMLKKRKAFYKESASKAWQGFEDRKTIPDYRNNEIENIRKDSLKQVVESLYTIEPAIFVGLKPEQEKTMLGLMDIVLDTDEKDDVIKIVDSVVNELTPEQRKDFAKTLDKIKLSNVVEVLKLVVSRQKVIEALRKLVFELTKFTNERDHIQLAVESNTWLFGEEFTAVTFDKNFQESLLKYTYVLDGKASPSELTDPEKKRRMDIFLTRQRLVSDPVYSNTTQLEENIIIELKRPDVVLGTIQMRQVQDYRNLIKRNPQFHSQMKVWRFFLVGNSIDDDVKAAYKTNEIRSKRFLIDWQEDFEVYAMTWADIFDMYRIRNDFLIKKLNVDKAAVQEELEARIGDISIKEQPNEITEAIQDEALVAA